MPSETNPKPAYGQVWRWENCDPIMLVAEAPSPYEDSNAWFTVDFTPVLNPNNLTNPWYGVGSRGWKFIEGDDD